MYGHMGGYFLFLDQIGAPRYTEIMAEEKDIPIEDMIGNPDQETEPGYDEWFREKVEKSLANSAAGAKTYTLDEITAEFGE